MSSRERTHRANHAMERTATPCAIRVCRDANPFAPIDARSRRPSLIFVSLGLMIARVWFALLLLLCAEPIVATDNYSYKADEYATISGGRSPDGRWSIAAHGEGEAGYGNFDLYLMREPAHEKPAPLRTRDCLDTAPLSIIA